MSSRNKPRAQTHTDTLREGEHSCREDTGANNQGNETVDKGYQNKTT